MTIEEIWSIPIPRIRAFLESLPEAEPTSEGVAFPGCRVVLASLSGQSVSPWPIPRTRVTMTGTVQAVTDIHHQFFLRFLSARG